MISSRYGQPLLHAPDGRWRRDSHYQYLIRPRGLVTVQLHLLYFQLSRRGGISNHRTRNEFELRKWGIGEFWCLHGCRIQGEPEGRTAKVSPPAAALGSNCHTPDEERAHSSPFCTAPFRFFSILLRNVYVLESWQAHTVRDTYFSLGFYVPPENSAVRFCRFYKKYSDYWVTRRAHVHDA